MAFEPPSIQQPAGAIRSDEHAALAMALIHSSAQCSVRHQRAPLEVGVRALATNCPERLVRAAVDVVFSILQLLLVVFGAALSRVARTRCARCRVHS
eukprot:5477684-Prymnesium_polylepis.1